MLLLKEDTSGNGYTVTHKQKSEAGYLTTRNELDLDAFIGDYDIQINEDLGFYYVKGSEKLESERNREH